MKKLLLTFGMLAIVLSGNHVAEAHSSGNTASQPTMSAPETRSFFKTYEFKSYPPSKYAGYYLVRAEKTSRGYKGYYK